METNALLTPGTRVDVRDSLGDWAVGFEVEATADRGYRLRRMSDGWVLPPVFNADRIRPTIR